MSIATNGIAVIDLETGGLDVRLNPPVQLAVVLADQGFKEIDGFALAIKPPPNTWLSIPADGSQGLGPDGRPFFNAPIKHWLNLETFEEGPRPLTGFELNGPALVLNGAMKLKDGRYDLEQFRYHFLANALPVSQLEKTYGIFLTQAFGDASPIVFAHNASFDSRFMRFWFPNLYARLAPGWACTHLSYAKIKGQRKGTKLADALKAAGVQSETAHEALSDARDCLHVAKWVVDCHIDKLVRLKDDE